VSFSKNETVVGIIIFFSLALMFLGLVWLEDYRFRGQGYMLVSHFQEVSGLNRGDPVTVSGMAIGRVQDMDLVDDGVAVSLWIERDLRLPKGSQAVIKSQGVMGERQVDILLGSSSQTLQPGERISGHYQADFSQVISQVGELGDELRSVLFAAGGLLSDTTSGGLRGTFAEVSGSAAQMRQLLDRNARQLDQTIEHLHTFSVNLARIEPGQNPEELIPNFQRASQNLVETAQRLRSLSDSLNSLLQPTLRGQSTLGRLLSDDTLYQDCQSLVVHMDSLVQDIHRNPHRYFKVEVF